MGKESPCIARLGALTSSGVARLEADHLHFRGDFRVTVPLNEITSVSASRDVLTVAWSEGLLALTLGDQAERWADAIRRPKTVLEKLGVRAGMVVGLIGLEDGAFRRQLRDAGATIVETYEEAMDMVFFQADLKKDLARLGRLKSHLAPAGAIWVVAPKGVPQIKDTDVIAAGRAAGLVDTKVARFSETYTALKFVVPLAQRS